MLTPYVQEIENRMIAFFNALSEKDKCRYAVIETLLTDAHVGLAYADQISATHGLLKVLRGAVNRLSFSGKKLVVSIDLDVIDLVDAPGVETPAQGGIKAEVLLNSLSAISRHAKICALEISEYYPDNDLINKTLHVIRDIIVIFYDLSNPNKSLGSLRSGINGILVPI